MSQLEAVQSKPELADLLLPAPGVLCAGLPDGRGGGQAGRHLHRLPPPRLGVGHQGRGRHLRPVQGERQPELQHGPDVRQLLQVGLVDIQPTTVIGWQLTYS